MSQGALSRQQFKFLYHESPADNRRLIQQEGIRPAKGGDYSGPEENMTTCS